MFTMCPMSAEQKDAAGSGPADGSGTVASGAPAGSVGSDENTSVRPRRRWPVVLLMIALTLLFAGPPLAAKWLRGEIERRGTEAIDGRVTLEGLSLTLNGKATLLGLVIEDSAGTEVLRVPEAKLDVGLRSLITGRKDIALRAAAAEIELVRDSEGEWNVAKLSRSEGAPEADPIPSDGPGASDGTGADAAGTEGEGSEDDTPGAPTSPPDVHGRLEFVDATVILRSPESVLQVRGVDFTIGLDGPEKETAVRLDASIFGGDGSVGDIAADIAVWPDAGPGVRVDSFELKALHLGVVAELLAILGSPLAEDSELAGIVDVTVSGRIDELVPSSKFLFNASAQFQDLHVDLREDGESTFSLDDPSPLIELSSERDTRGGEPRAAGYLTAREERIRAELNWDGTAKQGLGIEIDIDGVAANTGFEPLLARVHPAFASAQAIEGADLGAMITSDLAILYDDPIRLADLAAGWAALDKEPFRGTGNLTVDEGLIRTSPFIGELLEAFGQPVNPEFDLKTLGFIVDRGRVAYTSPWTWTIDGAETRFEGTVGLDSSLDLTWTVPVSGGLARANSVLESLAGEEVELKLGGTLTSPSLGLAGALSSLVQRVGKQKAAEELTRQTDRLREKVGGEAADAIEGIIGGKGIPDAGELLRGATGGKADVEALLKEADGLWDAGDKAGAAVIYRRIRKEFPLSPTYLFNKKRIKGRRNG